MEQVGQPVPPLRPFVRSYVQLSLHVPGEPVLLPIPARSTAVLEFTMGDPHDVLFTEQVRREGSHPCNVVGVQTYRRVELSMRGTLDSFVVVFQPGGWSALLSAPGDVLTNGHADGRAVCGAWVDDLRDRLGASSSFAERVRHADHCLLERRPAPSGHPGVAAAARALLLSQGSLQIAGLVARSGLSARQFERRFATHVGMSPKVYARIVRFEAALKRKEQVPELRWAAVAQELGYFDQMHMVHDFARLAGAPPSIAASELDIVRDESDWTSESNGAPRRVSIHTLLM